MKENRLLLILLFQFVYLLKYRHFVEGKTPGTRVYPTLHQGGEFTGSSPQTGNDPDGLHVDSQ